MPIQQWSDRIWILKLADEPQLSEQLTDLRQKADAADTMADLVIDLSAVTHLNSSSLLQLLRIRKLAVQRHATSLLTAVTESLRPNFATTGLDKLFNFAPDMPTALASLQIRQQNIDAQHAPARLAV